MPIFLFPAYVFYVYISLSFKEKDAKKGITT